MHTRPQALLFDLDGTLADTAPDFASAINRVCTAQGRPQVHESHVRQVASDGECGLLELAFGLRPGDPGFASLCEAFLNHYAQDLAVKTKLFPGIDALLLEVAGLGCRWGVVTNKPSRFTTELLPRIGLQQAQCVVSGDSTPHAKPHPEPLLEAARRLAVAPQDCWYVGDDERDMVAARAAGMSSIAVTWGYRGTDAAHTWQADVVVEHPLDILALLRKTHPTARP